MPDSLRVFLTTFPSEESAAAAVRSLVEECLAACGTLLPGARSIYRWKDAVEDAPEVAVVLKCPPQTAAALKARLVSLHPYEVPEILEWEPAGASEAYASWVHASCHPGTETA